MKKLISVFFVAFLTINMLLMLPSASAKTEPKGCNPLKVGKSYSFNLDKKGKNEKVLLSRKKIKSQKYSYALKINGKVVYSTVFDNNKLNSDDLRVLVIDTDKSDNQMEVLILRGYFDKMSWISDIRKIYYYKYSNNKFVLIQNLTCQIKNKMPNTSVHALNDNYYFHINENRKITLRFCLRIGQTSEYYHFLGNFILKNGRYSITKNEEFVLKDSNMVYTSTGKNVTYVKVGSKKTSFTLKKNSKFYMRRIVIRNKEIYLQLENKSHKFGYIKHKNLKYQFRGTLHV